MSDELVRVLRRSTLAEVEEDIRRLRANVNFDGLTRYEEDALYMAMLRTHGWTYGDYWQELNKRDK